MSSDVLRLLGLSAWVNMEFSLLIPAYHWGIDWVHYPKSGVAHSNLFGTMLQRLDGRSGLGG